jgi:hypothetical protein
MGPYPFRSAGSSSAASRVCRLTVTWTAAGAGFAVLAGVGGRAEFDEFDQGVGAAHVDQLARVDPGRPGDVGAGVDGGDP